MSSTKATKRSKAPTASCSTSQMKQKLSNGTSTHDNDEKNLPELDELPGSLKASISSKENGVNGISASKNASSKANRSKSRRARRQKLVDAEEKQRSTSDAVLQFAGLPVAGAVLYNLIYPVASQLTARDTRHPSYHIHHFLHKCVHLSYRLPTYSSVPVISKAAKAAGAASSTSIQPLYVKGKDDFYFLGFYFLVFMLLREVVMRFVFIPLGRYGGIKSKKDLLRFGEQGYNLFYYSIAWSCGVWIMQHSEYRNITLEALWKGYPHYKLTWQLKSYYLMQGAFWVSQIMVINIEKRRKDYYQMLTHHLITLTLMTLSYLFNWTRVGNVILVLMDPCDILLSAAKMLKYFHFERTCDSMFVAFMGTWVITRLVLYPRVLLSVIFDANKYIAYKWKPSKEHFLTPNVHKIFIALLSMLQVLLLLWFVMIVKVALAVVTGKGAEDSRSDDEDDVEDTSTDEGLNGSPNRLRNGHSNGHKSEQKTL